MRDYATAGQGLNKIFIGAILCIFTAIPFVGGILVIVGFVFNLKGLTLAGKVHEGYKKAFTITIVNLVVTALTFLFSGLSVVSSVLGFVVTYLVCISTAELLIEVGNHELADKGIAVWKFILICTIIAVVAGLVGLIGVAADSIGLAGIAAVALCVSVVAGIVGSIRYLLFIYNAQKALQ